MSPPADLPTGPGESFGAGSTAPTVDRDPQAGPGGLTLVRWGLTEPTPSDGPREGARTANPSFRLLRPIGRGGMGVVWEAEQTSLGRAVAVKRIDPAHLSELTTGSFERRAAILSFQQEACIAARLEHPNIVPIHDQGVDDDGSPLLAMKRVQGEPWSRILIRERESTPPADFVARHVAILMQVSQAVAFAHSRGIVHRDLKPSQVMIGDFGEVMLTDWGLALDLHDVPADRLAQPPYPVSVPDREWASSPSGTPGFMAPEQTEDSAARVGRWTDVYLLGGTLFQVLTGMHPHPGETPGEAFEHAAHGLVGDPRERAPDAFVPEELAELCNACLCPEPRDRLRSAADFTARLQDYLTGTSRRRRSSELTTAVAETLPRESRSYAAYADALARLEEAAGLWPDNPALQPLRAAARERYARSALNQGDLILARAQGEALEDAQVRAAILADVAEAERMVARQRTRLRAAVAATVAMLAVLLISSIVVSAKFREQRDAEATLRASAEKARRVALARARDGNAAIDFLMGDVSQALDPQLPSDQKLIKAVADRAVAHFNQMDLNEDEPETQIEMALALQRVARSLSRLGRDGDAAMLCVRAADLWGKAMGGVSLGEARVWLEAAQYERRNGNMPDAERNLDRAIEQFPQVAEEMNWADRWSIAHVRAGIERELGKWEQAEASYLEALSKIDDGPDYPEHVRECRAQTRGELAGMYTFQGRRDEALAMTEELLKDFEESAGPDSLEATSTRQELAHLLASRGEIARAAELYSGVEKRLLELFPPDHPRFINLYQRMGELEYAQGENEKAGTYYDRAITIAESVFGDDYYYLAPLMQGAGVIAIRLSDWRTARARFDRALELQRARHGEDSPYLVELLLSVGVVHSHDGDTAGAEHAYRRALEITQQHYAPEHPNHGFCKVNLAEWLAEEGRMDEADTQLSEGYENLKAAFGPTHPHVVAVEALAIDFRARRARMLSPGEARPQWEAILADVEAIPERKPGIAYLLGAEALLRLERADEIEGAIEPWMTPEVQDSELLRYLDAAGLMPKDEPAPGPTE